MVKICSKCGARSDFESRFCSNCGDKFEEAMKPTFTPVEKMQPEVKKVQKPSDLPQGTFRVAEGGKRFWAYIIDTILTSIFISAIIGFAGVAAYGDADFFASASGYYFESFPFSIGTHGTVLFIYFIITEYFLGHTIGKSILGIKIVDEDGQAPSLVSVIVNSFGKSFGIWFDVIAGWIFVQYPEGTPKLEQRLFQKFAAIVTVEAPKYVSNAHFVSND